MIRSLLLMTLAAWTAAPAAEILTAYDAAFPAGDPRPVLTPVPGPQPRINGPRTFGVRPGKPMLYAVPATGRGALTYAAQGLPAGMAIDGNTGLITGTAPAQAGTWPVRLQVTNHLGTAEADLAIVVGDTICLTPPMGWNSWYVYSESVSDTGIRRMADAMRDAGLVAHGWSYINIDDCWTGERDPVSLAIRGNRKFPDMPALSAYVHGQGMKLGLYSTPWMSTYAGYIGGSAPNAAADYSAHYRPVDQREGPGQYFGRYPGGIRQGLCAIGPVWLIDRDARQFAAWGVDFVKYDWKEWPLVRGADGTFAPDEKANHDKTEAITRRFHDDFRAVDRDIVLSLSPRHSTAEDPIAVRYANLWRLTEDIQPTWACLTAPFGEDMASRHALSGPGHFGDLDMLQIGSIGVPNSTNTVFKPSPLTPAEQYFQVSLWCLLQQPLLLSCDLSHLDDFTRGLITNDDVLAINQDAAVKPARRVASSAGSYEIWRKELADGRLVFGLFNLADHRQALPLTTGGASHARDLWRQRDLGPIAETLAVSVEAHGAALIALPRP